MQKLSHLKIWIFYYESHKTTGLSCGYPGDINFGHVEATEDYLYDSYVKYSCDSTHSLIGSAERPCKAEGEVIWWDYSTPTCNGRDNSNPDITSYEQHILKPGYICFICDDIVVIQTGVLRMIPSITVDVKVSQNKSAKNGIVASFQTLPTRVNIL